MLLLDDVQRPQLLIPEPEQQQIWDQRLAVANPAQRWSIFLNQLTVATLLPWLEQQGLIEKFDFERQASQEQRSQSESVVDPATPSLRIWPSPTEAAQLWEWVNGTAIETDSVRLVLIPTDTIDTSEFRVPQEWVDIPTWVADYYLMVQLNPDAELLQVRGYVTHRQIKQGEYCGSDRTYTIDESALVQDLDLLSIMVRLESVAERRVEIAALPELTPSQAGLLIEQLYLAAEFQTSVTPSSALTSLRTQRLGLTFEQWGAILQTPRWRHHLIAQTSAGLPFSRVVSAPVQLRQWFQENFEVAWQPLAQLFSPGPALAFRQLPVQETVQARSFSRGKVLRFDALENPLVLCTTIRQALDGRIGIRVQLRPLESQQLVKGIELVLVSPTQEVLQVVTAREDDDYIQLTRFKVIGGQAFDVEIRLGEQTICESFQV